MGFKYWSGGHTKYRLMYHVVFIPKYRKRVLVGKIAHKLYEIFYEAAKVNRWWIEELKVMKDHVHMMIQIQANTSISEAVMYLKGGSSRQLRKEFPEIKEFLWGKSFWADGYFAETVGEVNYQVVKKYIKENKEIMPQAGKQKPRALARE